MAVRGASRATPDCLGPWQGSWLTRIQAVVELVVNAMAAMRGLWRDRLREKCRRGGRVVKGKWGNAGFGDFGVMMFAVCCCCTSSAGNATPMPADGGADGRRQTV
ncbi:hypothetical protein BDV09DRAFT_4807 [Aspergillus tetrazonus]